MSRARFGGKEDMEDGDGVTPGEDRFMNGIEDAIDEPSKISARESLNRALIP